MVKREEETTKNSLTINECLINTVSHLKVSTVQEWTQLQMNPETGCREQVCGKRAGSDRCCLGVRMALPQILPSAHYVALLGHVVHGRTEVV